MHHFSANPRSAFVAVAFALLLTGTLLAAPPAGAQDTNAEEPRARPWIRAPHEACPPGVPPETEWSDEGPGVEVRCTAWYGVASGTSSTRFGRFQVVTRGQMATFIANVIDYAAEDGQTRSLPDYDGENRFSDAEDSVHVANINRLAEVGVVRGGPHGRSEDEYGPGLAVRRDQMATFLNGAQQFMTGDGFGSDNDFFDDDDGNVHETSINAIAEHALTGGIGDPGSFSERRYRARNSLERRQMASFLMRLLDVHVSERRVTTPGDRDAQRSNASFVFREVVDTAEVSSTELTDEGATTFEVTELGDQPVSLALFDCHDVFRTAGIVEFRDTADPAGEADLTVDDEGAVIEQVNGSPRVERDNYVSDVEPEDGEVSFVADSTTADCVAGVAFADGNDNDALDVDDDGAPTEQFGASTPLVFLPDAAGNGEFDVTVVHVDRVGHAFVGADDSGTARTYQPATTDDLSIDGARVGFGEFTARLSPGDTVTGEVNTADDADRAFGLDDSDPQAPTLTDESAWEPSGVTLRWGTSPTPTVRGYRIFRRSPCDSSQIPLRAVAEVNANVTTYVEPTEKGTRPECTDYAVRAIDSRDESADTEDSTVQLRGTQLLILDLAVTRDAGTKGRMDAGDRHRFVFNRPMDIEIGARDYGEYVVIGDEWYEVTCDVEGRDSDPATTDCRLNDQAVTIDGETYDPGHVWVIDLGTDVTDTWDPEWPPLYPLRLDVAPCCDRWGNAVEIRESPDTTLDVE